MDAYLANWKVWLAGFGPRWDHLNDNLTSPRAWFLLCLYHPVNVGANTLVGGDPRSSISLHSWRTRRSNKLSRAINWLADTLIHPDGVDELPYGPGTDDDLSLEWTGFARTGAVVALLLFFLFGRAEAQTITCVDQAGSEVACEVSDITVTVTVPDCPDCPPPVICPEPPPCPDCPPACPVEPPVEVIVDNGDANTTQTGSWPVSGGPNPYGADSVYSSSTGIFTWRPQIPAAGQYEVYAWWTYHPSRSRTVPYTITSGGQSFTVNVNQNDEALGGQWNLLGAFQLENGASVSVSGGSKDNGQQASADAVRLVQVAPTEPVARTLNWQWPTTCVREDGTTFALAEDAIAGLQIYNSSGVNVGAKLPPATSFEVLSGECYKSYVVAICAGEDAAERSDWSNEICYPI